MGEFRAFGPGSELSAFSGGVRALLASFGNLQALRAELLNMVLSAGPLSC